MKSKLQTLKYLTITVLISTVFLSVLNYFQQKTINRTVIETGFELAKSWRHISKTLSLETTKTERGALVPLLRPAHSALDLVIYGDQITQPLFQENYKEIIDSNFIGKVAISNDEFGFIKYHIAGYEIASLDAVNNNQIIVSFYKIPEAMARRIDEQLDRGQYDPKSGIVRYNVASDGQTLLSLIITV
jgi:hypothetical protein